MHGIGSNVLFSHLFLISVLEDGKKQTIHDCYYTVSQLRLLGVVTEELSRLFLLNAGSAWMVLSRSFVEYCIVGWDNLPRTLLMYYANFVSSPEGYFQTLVCNTPEYVHTVANHDMHYISWDYPPKQHPHTLSVNDTAKMVASGAAFARKFKRDDPVLDQIDKELLGRKNGGFTPGGWCSGKPRCSKVGDITKLKPGPGAKRLRQLLDRLVSSPEFSKHQCEYHPH